jgi:hypothetical protein
VRASSLFSGANTVRTSIFGFDLKGAFVAAMLEWIDAGWQIGEFSCRSVHFFCTKIVELQTVEISPTDPGIEYYAPTLSSRMDPQ